MQGRKLLRKFQAGGGRVSKAEGGRWEWEKTTCGVFVWVLVVDSHLWKQEKENIFCFLNMPPSCSIFVIWDWSNNLKKRHWYKNELTFCYLLFLSNVLNEALQKMKIIPIHLPNSIQIEMGWIIFFK